MRVTKYVILSPECTDILPCDISTMIYESKRCIDIKETCFGAIIEGEEDAIKSVVEGSGALTLLGFSLRTEDSFWEIPGAADGMPPDLRANYSG